MKARHIKLLTELVGPSSQWPINIRMTLFGKKHLNNPDRFKCTVFLLNNGVDPILIKEVYADTFNFDVAAWRHIEYIIRNFPYKKWSSWNVALGHSVPEKFFPERKYEYLAEFQNPNE